MLSWGCSLKMNGKREVQTIERREHRIDEALKETFPASGPLLPAPVEPLALQVPALLQAMASRQLMQKFNDELIHRGNPNLALVTQHLDRNVVVVPAQHQVDG